MINETTNGTEYQTKYETNDGEVFNSYTQAMEHLIIESTKTSTCTSLAEFKEYYY